MASVTSLDQDMRKLRHDRYTPGAANEIRSWIESMIGERLAPGDLMEALKDGVALCKLVNLAVSPGVRYKESNMPFVQMENISHFLRACEVAPLNLPAHDRFLTVDLYDGKDPTQVLQCIAAFSRRANVVNPTNIPYPLGGKTKGSTMSPQGTGSSTGPRSPAYTTTSASRPRGTSAAAESQPAYTFNPLNKAAYSTSNGRTSPTKPSLARGGLAPAGPVSSWSSKGDQGNTAPAWNIHQYGYMGGASQGNLGVAFGARRQITSQPPEVPSLAEKEKRLREKIEQEKRDAEERARQEQQQEEAEAEQRRLEEEQARREEERRWEEETRRLRQKEEEGARQWEEEQRQRKQQQRREAEEREREREQENKRRLDREAAEAQEREAQAAKERSRQRTTSDARLNGQFLSQYQAGQAKSSPPAPPPTPNNTAEARRIADLERQLEELRVQQRQAASVPATQPRQQPSLPSRQQPSEPLVKPHGDNWDTSEREYLRDEWSKAQTAASDGYTPPKPPLPQPAESALPARPLPDPSPYQPGTNRTDRFLSSNPAPQTPQAGSYRAPEHAHSTTAEVDAENARRLQSQQKTKAGGWASKSLLEREMERERERQREWEAAQKESATATRDVQQGSRPGQSWDVHQYGYMGGDSQNRGGPGLGVGGARRQIIGPRPPP